MTQLREIEDYDLGASAVDRHIGTSMFMPSVAELLEATRVVTAEGELEAVNEDAVRWLMREKHITHTAAVAFERARMALIQETEDRRYDPTFDYVEWEERYDAASAEALRHVDPEFA